SGRGGEGDEDKGGSPDALWKDRRREDGRGEVQDSRGRVNKGGDSGAGVTMLLGNALRLQLPPLYRDEEKPVVSEDEGQLVFFLCDGQQRLPEDSVKLCHRPNLPRVLIHSFSAFQGPCVWSVRDTSCPRPPRKKRPPLPL